MVFMGQTSEVGFVVGFPPFSSFPVIMTEDPGNKMSRVSLCQMAPLPLDLETRKDSPVE